MVTGISARAFFRVMVSGRLLHNQIRLRGDIRKIRAALVGPRRVRCDGRIDTIPEPHEVPRYFRIDSPTSAPERDGTYVERMLNSFVQTVQLFELQGRR